MERATRPLLDRTVAATRAVLAGAGIGRPDRILLVGGATRMPLVATVVHRAFGLAPTVLDNRQRSPSNHPLPVGDDPTRPADHRCPRVELHHRRIDRSTTTMRMEDPPRSSGTVDLRLDVQEPALATSPPTRFNC